MVTSRDALWWNKELGRLKSGVRKLFNRVKRLGTRDDYEKAFTEYNKELRKSKKGYRN